MCSTCVDPLCTVEAAGRHNASPRAPPRGDDLELVAAQLKGEDDVRTLSDQVLQPFKVVKSLRQKGVHASQHSTTDHHAHHQVIAEPGIALALHG